MEIAPTKKKKTREIPIDQKMYEQKRVFRLFPSFGPKAPIFHKDAENNAMFAFVWVKLINKVLEVPQFPILWPLS